MKHIFSITVALFLLCAATACSSGGDSSSPSDSDKKDSSTGSSAGGDFNIDDLSYLGAFRISSSNFGSNVSSPTVFYSEGAIGYNSDNNSLFVDCNPTNNGAVGEFAIPTLVKSTTITELNMVTESIQDFSDVLGRDTFDIQGGTRPKVGGMYYHNKRLLVSAFSFYGQAQSDTQFIIIDDATDIENSTDSGYLHAEPGGGAAAGWVTPIPEEYQEDLGGTHISGLSGSTWRANTQDLSRGPAAYAINIGDVMDDYASLDGTVPTVELIRYTLDNPLKTIDEMYNDAEHGHPENDNKVWTNTSEVTIGIIVPGTDTYLCLGFSSGHETGIEYVDHPAWDDTGNKGYWAKEQDDQYAYYWMYHVSDMIKVRKGEMEPYEIEPYECGPWSNAPFQTSGDANPVGGGTYDEVNKILYLSMRDSDNEQSPYGNTPIYAAFSFGE